MTTAGGYRLATSIDGTLTGRGGDIIIIDDPLKPADALSEPKRERVNQWYFNTLLSRLDDKQAGAVIVVMQRLHMDDLSGALLRDCEEWTHLKLSAIAESEEQISIGRSRFYQRRSGDVLHPEREPMSVLQSIRAQLGSDTFTAQYQQSPVPPGGAMIKRAWVLRYEQLPTPQNRRVIQSWDTANKEGGEHDWSVCSTWLIDQNKYYLVDLLRGRFDYPTLKARVLEHASLHKPSKILIEDAGVGMALVQELRAGSRFSVIPIKPEHDKMTRMSIQSGKFESGRVYLPERACWLPELETELFAFPGSRYDDQVDSISQALADNIGYFDANSLAGHIELLQGFAMDRYIGRVTGRPW
jgi:predicted phage terminase large subunit-like protein